MYNFVNGHDGDPYTCLPEERADLIIRNEQMEEFRKVAKRNFENEMVAHLAQFSPPLSKAVGEEQMREVIRFGMAKSAGYGFVNRGPVRLYLELMLLLGSHFDSDPQYPWAAEILTDDKAGPQMERADLLYEETMQYREKVAGPEDEYTLQALRNIRRWAEQPMLLTRENLVAELQWEIRRVYPQKANYTGKDALEVLIGEGKREALQHGFPPVRGIALMVILMLAFGHGCSHDPLYPWIARTLKDEAITDSGARAKRLETKALTWLDHVLAYFDKSAKA